MLQSPVYFWTVSGTIVIVRCSGQHALTPQTKSVLTRLALHARSLQPTVLPPQACFSPAQKG